MCGIFGWHLTKKPKSYQRAALAAALMLSNDRRGGHSWGYYCPGEAQPRHGLGDISASLQARRLGRLDRLMAHTRLATQGDIAMRNCHPFVCGNVVGAHNGCISNHHELNRLYRPCEVDSMHLFWHLNDEEPLESIEAYGAIEFVYLDQPERVYLGYFNGGDLAVAETAYGTVWSSAEEALVMALTLAGIKHRLYKLEEGLLYCVRAGVLYDTDCELGVAPYRALLKWWDYKDRKASDTLIIDELDEEGWLSKDDYMLGK